MPDDAELLHARIPQVWDSFADFRTYRGELDDDIRRRGKIELEPELQAYARKFDDQTPDLEWAVQEYVAIETLGTTRIDCVALEPGPEAARDVEDIRIWLAWSMLEQNKDRILDLARAEAQVRYGYAVERTLWHMPTEQDGGYGDDAEKALKDREDYFRGKDEHCFQTIPVSPLEVAFFPLHDYKFLVQQSEVPVLDAYNLQAKDKQRVTLDALKKIAFVGESEPLPEHYSASAFHEHKVKLTIVDYCDPKTKEWWMVEFVEPSGSTDKDDRKELSRYKNPLGRCSYFITPCGTELPSERDPNLRFRPRIYRLWVYAKALNFWITRMAALAVKKESDEDVYFDISTMREDLVGAMEELGIVESVGAQKRFVFRKAEPGSGEIVGAPTLKKWPNDIEPHELKVFEHIKEMVAQAMPNRWLLGTVPTQDIGATPATSALDQHQAAATPINMDLMKGDGTQRARAEAQLHAIATWEDEDAPKYGKKMYYAVVGSNLPTSKGNRNVGDVVKITADHLKRKFEITALTKNETSQEKAQSDLAAYQAFDRRTIDFKQLLKRLGHDDPEHQMEDLDEFWTEQDYGAMFQQDRLLAIRTLFFALSGMKPPMEQPQQVTQGQPAQNGSRPPYSGGQGQVANALGTREGPAGGSSPMAGIQG